jgi:hypothetical protein
MREVATKVVTNGFVTEEYKVQKDHAGDVVLSSRASEANVLLPDVFHIPRAIRSWVSAAVALDVIDKPVSRAETGIEFSARYIRTFADRVRAEMPDLSAQAALQMIADILDGGRSAIQPTPGSRVIPIRGVAVDGRVVHIGGGFGRVGLP